MKYDEIKHRVLCKTNGPLFSRPLDSCDCAACQLSFMVKFTDAFKGEAITSYQFNITKNPVVPVWRRSHAPEHHITKLTESVWAAGGDPIKRRNVRIAWDAIKYPITAPRYAAGTALQIISAVHPNRYLSETEVIRFFSRNPKYVLSYDDLVMFINCANENKPLPVD